MSVPGSFVSQKPKKLPDKNEHKKEDQEILQGLKRGVPGFVKHMEREAKVMKAISNPPPKVEGVVTQRESGSYLTATLEEWDPLSLPENFFLVLEGKRRTGKSTFAKWLLQYYRDRFNIVWVMTKTKANCYWQGFVGEAFTFDNYYPHAIRQLINRNDKIIGQFGTDSAVTKYLASCLVILDDVVSAKIHDDPMFTLLACEGHHHKISIILMTQDPKAIGPKVRDNADVAVVFNQKTYRNKESIWHDFMNDIDKDSSFGLLGRYAVGHDALVCIQTNLNGDIS